MDLITHLTIRFNDIEFSISTVLGNKLSHLNTDYLIPLVPSIYQHGSLYS